VKFFVPDTDDPGEAEQFYSALRGATEALKGPVTYRRVLSVTFTRGGKIHSATVGGLDTASGAACVAIFESAQDGLFYICVEGRLQDPFMAGSPSRVEYFDASEGGL